MPSPSDPSLTDDLTGLSNERHFEILYEFAFSVAERGIPLCVAIFEIDEFDRFREERGAEAGKAAIRRLGEILGSTTRQMDVSARFVGSRCASLLVDCNLQGAMVFADRVVDLAGELEDEWGLILNVGLSGYEPSMEGRPESLREGAEAALREAATQGSGTVAVHRGA